MKVHWDSRLGELAGIAVMVVVGMSFGVGDLHMVVVEGLKRHHKVVVGVVEGWKRHHKVVGGVVEGWERHHMVVVELGVERDHHRKTGARCRIEGVGIDAEVGFVRKDRGSVGVEVGCS